MYKKSLYATVFMSVMMSALTVTDVEARRCCRRGSGASVAAGIFAGAIAGAALAGSADVDYYGYYYPYVEPNYRVFYPGAPIYAYDYPTYKYSPIYSYPYDNMYAPGYYRPIY